MRRNTSFLAALACLMLLFTGQATAISACDPTAPVVPCTTIPGSRTMDAVIGNGNIISFYEASAYDLSTIPYSPYDLRDLTIKSGAAPIQGEAWIWGGSSWSNFGGFTGSQVELDSNFFSDGVGNFAMKLPLPGGKNWLLTVEAGGDVFCGGGTDTYHTGSGHYSLDFDDLASVGQQSSVPIYAPADGTIDSYGNSGSTGYGHWVKVDHGNGYMTLYAHMTAQTLITSGAVAQGDQLGTVGTSGSSTGTHLHFQVYYAGDSSSSAWQVGLTSMEGTSLDNYAVGCSTYYSSTNTP